MSFSKNTAEAIVKTLTEEMPDYTWITVKRPDPVVLTEEYTVDAKESLPLRHLSKADDILKRVLVELGEE